MQRFFVVPDDHYGDFTSCSDHNRNDLRDLYAESKQRYSLDDSSSSLTWSPTHSSPFVPPSPELVEENFGKGKGGDGKGGSSKGEKSKGAFPHCVKGFLDDVLKLRHLYITL